MPLYEYQCEKCGRFELILKFSDPALSACPTCGGPIQKLLSSPAIQFKGTGWYVTDYARKSSGNGGKSPEAGKAESGKSESKDAGSATKSEASSGGGSTSGTKS